MEEQLNPLAVAHLLQHALRSLCIQENSQWVYAVFWRILPRNYPPPKWDLQGGAYDRTRGNRRNWILVWEDGFCNFAASTSEGTSAAYGECEMKGGLQPELFFKMSHEIYNFGEGLIGKVAADHSHKWVFKEPQDHEVNFLSSWNNPADSQPRTWEAQFHAGIKTIALVAVREGVVQLGAIHKVMEDLGFVVLLRKKFHYLEGIPGVLLPHPSSAAFRMRMDDYSGDGGGGPDSWAFPLGGPPLVTSPPPLPMELYDVHLSQQVRITPSMSSLEALLSKLPSVCAPAVAHSSSPEFYQAAPAFMPVPQKASTGVMAKEEMEEEYDRDQAMLYYANGSKPDEGF